MAARIPDLPPPKSVLLDKGKPPRAGEVSWSLTPRRREGRAAISKFLRVPGAWASAERRCPAMAFAAFSSVNDDRSVVEVVTTVTVVLTCVGVVGYEVGRVEGRSLGKAVGAGEGQ